MLSDLQLAEYALNSYHIRGIDLGSGIQYSLHVEDTYVVVAVRGTDQGTDWMTNLRAFPRFDKVCGMCHYGYLKAARLVAFDVHRRLKEVDLSNRRVYFTGHSMGGSVAGLAAMLLEGKYGVDIYSGSIFGASKPFVFGRPKLKFTIKCFRNEYDPVVKTPLGFWGFAKNETLHTAFGHSMLCYVNNLKE